jgi:hypothetical protein
MFEYARLAIENLDFDGLRFDFVKGFGAWMIELLAKYRTRRKMAESSFPLQWESTGRDPRISTVGSIKGVR